MTNYDILLFPCSGNILQARKIPAKKFPPRMIFFFSIFAINMVYISVGTFTNKLLMFLTTLSIFVIDTRDFIPIPAMLGNLQLDNLGLDNVILIFR